jgi:hypothetical protein
MDSEGPVAGPPPDGLGVRNHVVEETLTRTLFRWKPLTSKEMRSGPYKLDLARNWLIAVQLPFGVANIAPWDRHLESLIDV